MNEQEWLAKEQELQASAFKMLRNALKNVDTAKHAGLSTIPDVIEFIKGMEINIYKVIGDCPT